MKNGWIEKRLEDICVISPPKKEARDRINLTDTISFIPMEDLGIRKKYFPCLKTRSLINVIKSYTYFADGDILLAKITPCFENGKLGIARNLINGIGFGSSEYIVLRPTETIYNEYLFYYLSQDEFVKEGSKQMFGAVGQKRISKDFIKNLPIRFPNISEQKRIVAILDEAFAAIDKAKANVEKNLQNARELFEAYLSNIFTSPGDDWEVRKLGDICAISDGTHFSPKNGNHGKFMYITAKNIKEYYIDISNITYVSEEDHRQIYARCPVAKGDVLYIKDGATAGIAAINGFDEEFSLLSSVALFKTSEKVLNTFLVHYLNSSVGKKNFLGHIDGAAITRLTLIKLKNIFIPLPPISEQQKIVFQLDELLFETKNLEKIFKLKLEAFEELKATILQEAFNGELTEG